MTLTAFNKKLHFNYVLLHHIVIIFYLIDDSSCVTHIYGACFNLSMTFLSAFFFVPYRLLNINLTLLVIHCL